MVAQDAISMVIMDHQWPKINCALGPAVFVMAGLVPAIHGFLAV
jgi:hypothetical protein